jgi:L-amino acid N-acyltransferase YncA
MRSGPYRERAGCGYLEISESIDVVREFKVHPGFRGRGFGRRLLIELAARVAANTGRVVIGIVSPENPASRRAFEGAGFVAAGIVETRRVAGIRRVTPLVLPPDTSAALAAP